ncbi:MAG TPA: TerB family tellurite resistance protein [Hypericibacter adhaerens]|jgi:DnaJ like chaperone protein|uniref:Molecular chaperone DjlA n=1 Tax=Hypericibacter adhaerens TaxID=2602016 RepID=A0A5J6MX12_9PROT|nr:TerB family tellurite resistance protein [Hypericibacter adhaerens]QEX21235.1 molecular chaperone DjlA [Hypericibacter adhaerens]HWA43393.1 TerB family tellurite resistance protein [Hypericibacter adhaerens]
MSIWGKILGGAAGFALGGPVGALAGAVAGHAVDMLTEANLQQGDATGTAAPADERAATRQIAFTIGVIVLGAKMAKADGRVTREEIVAFKEVFRVPPQELRNVGRFFDQARQDAQGFEPYARQIAKMFPRKSRVLEELIDGLFHIAKADGAVSADELDYLRRVAQIFGFADADFERIRHSHLGPDESDPYTLLGVTRDSSDAEIKLAWRKLIRETHPDKLIAKGLPQEFVDLATDKMARINAAYDRIAKERGIE